MNTTMLRRILASLLVGMAVLFAIGVAIEKGDSHEEGANSATAHPGVASAVVATFERAIPSHEGDGGEEGEPSDESTKREVSDAGETKILGVKLESTGAVIAAVVVSVLLAISVLRMPRRMLFVLVGIVCVAFAAADIAEAVNKFDDSEAGIGAIATVVAVGHLAAALISGYLTRQPDTATASA